MSDNQDIKISIITVVYNSEKFVESTIKSIKSQQYGNIEYIVIDGASTDNTLDILKSYSEDIDILVSEKDDGLYYAMNKAIQLATGDYLWFINSGDEIYSSDTLIKIITAISSCKTLPDVIYGETEIIDQNGKALGMRRHKAPETLTWKSLRLGMKVCHQSVIVSKRVALLYNTKYRYSSDFEWLIRVLMKSDHIYNSHFILSKFMEGGITNQSLTAGLKERFAIMSKYYGKVSTVFIHFYLMFRLMFFYIRNKRF